uniref:RxLR effector protein n=1 Tax=Phytophthora sojae TaxID=67593 RepID=G1FQU8_PHYSO|nr:Avh18a1 [Phytophthora sojae]
MRLTYVLLVAVTTLLVSCDATKPSTEATAVSKRLLRFVEAADEEERRIDFSPEKLRKMLGDETYRLKKFGMWDSDGHTFDGLKHYLLLSDSSMVKLRNMYKAWLEQ